MVKSSILPILKFLQIRKLSSMATCRIGIHSKYAYLHVRKSSLLSIMAETTYPYGICLSLIKADTSIRLKGVLSIAHKTTTRLPGIVRNFLNNHQCSTPSTLFFRNEGGRGGLHDRPKLESRHTSDDLHTSPNLIDIDQFVYGNHTK